MTVTGPHGRWVHREVEATDTYDASLQAQDIARQMGGTVDQVRRLPTATTGSAGPQQHARWTVRIALPPEDDPA